MTAVQDWLNIRPLDPINHVKAFICALRGVHAEAHVDIAVEPVLIRPGVERC